MTPWIRHRAALALSAACAAAAAPAAAHVTLAERQAQAGGYSRLTLQVPHGCAGRPTTGLAVDLPPGLASVKPMPKPGWTLDVQRQGDNVSRVTWTARTREDALADSHYDEFVLVATAPAEPATVEWPVEQVCVQGRSEWKPKLEIIPSAAAGGHKH